ncbi:ATP-binding cassette domain-containing protein [Bacillus sp. C1-1]|nr:ATP-binding cassette domain-containing protein [Bacillus sp. C1-1]
MDVCFKDVSYQYETNQATSNKALQEVSFSIPDGSFTAVIGKTGSGKSTLVQLLAGLLKPTTGAVLLNGHTLHEDQNQLIRNHIGYVFQYPEHQLFAETVYEELAFGLKLAGEQKEQIEQRIEEIMKVVELESEILQRSPFHLSGGQMRRVAIAAILMMKPKLLLIDEPTAGLDPQLKEGMMKVFQRYKKQEHATVWMVTHSMNDVALYSDHCIALEAGLLVRAGKTCDVLQSGHVPLPHTMAFAKALMKHQHQPPFLKNTEELVGWITSSWLKEKENEYNG